jgi:hypothetical protein
MIGVRVGVGDGLGEGVEVGFGVKVGVGVHVGRSRPLIPSKMSPGNEPHGRLTMRVGVEVGGGVSVGFGGTGVAVGGAHVGELNCVGTAVGVRISAVGDTACVGAGVCARDVAVAEARGADDDGASNSEGGSTVEPVCASEASSRAAASIMPRSNGGLRSERASVL